MNTNDTDWPFEHLHLQWQGLDSQSYDLSVPNAVSSIPTHALWIIQRGTAQVMVGGQRFLLRENHCVLFPPGSRVEFAVEQGQTMYVHALTFAASMLNGAADSQEDVLSSFEYRPTSVTPLSPLLTMLDNLKEYKETRNGLEKFRRGILLQEVLYTYLARVSSGQPANSREAVEQTILYMKEHYHRKLNVNDLSAMAEVGPRQYSHIFKQMTGASPIDYLYRLRIEQAKKLLKASDRNMLTIANQVGFRDEFYFSRRFKQQVGVPPTLYLKNQQPRVIGLLYTSHLLALGLTPVGAPDYHLLQNEYVYPYLSSMKSFQWDPCDMDEIRQMEPDIILGYEHMTPGEYEQFSRIAEVVRVTWQSQDVYQQLGSVSSVIDKHQQGRDWLENHEEKVMQTKERLRALIGDRETCAAFVIDKDGFRVAGDRNMGHVLYHALNWKPHPLVQRIIAGYNGSNVFSDALAFDEICDYDADRIFVMVNDRDPGAEAAFRKLLHTQAWQSLKAVRSGSAHIVSFERWWMYSPLAVEGQLKDIEAFIGVR